MASGKVTAKTRYGVSDPYHKPKDVKISARITVPDFADLELVAKRLGVKTDKHGKFNISQALALCIRRTKKELVEPTIKFDLDNDF